MPPRLMNESSALSRNDDQLPVVATSSKPSLLPRLIAGSIGSIAVALAVTPLEVVKVRQQAIRAAPSPLPPPKISLCSRGCGTFILSNGLMECVLPKSIVPYFDAKGQLTQVAAAATKQAMAKPSPLGTFAHVRRIFLQEGFAGIYAGLAPTLVMSVPNTVLYFTAYDEIAATLRHYHRNHQPQHGTMSNTTTPSWIPLISGSSARTLASIATAPLELIRTRQASLAGQSQASSGLYNEFRTMIQEEGAVSLYRGLGPTLWRDAPFSAIYWLVVEKMNELVWNDQNTAISTTTQYHHHSLQPPAVAASQAFVNGAIAGMIAAAVTAPFDVVKTRQQIGQTFAATADIVVLPETKTVAIPSEYLTSRCHHDGAIAYKDAATTTTRVSFSPGTFHVMKQIWRDEGISGLWRGNQTRMIKVAPACAIMISCYEFGKQVME